MAVAAILLSDFYLFFAVNIVIFHRSMACNISNILDFLQLSKRYGLKYVFLHDLGFMEAEGQIIGRISQNIRIP